MTGPDLSPGDFATFFRCVNAWSEEHGWAGAEAGPEPFPWQRRLLCDWVAGPKGWPPVLDLPTGSGKTAAMDIAVFHLAMEAHKREDRSAPVRIAFVVDRRLIVDDAYLRAKRIAKALAAAAIDDSTPDVVRKVAARLGRLAERKDRPLLARRLRGGVPREDDWARTPSQPTILCSTVDQVGSRLLFRGYGVSNSMKPVHAGLLGSDCLILLDEAHLSAPFRQTLAAVARLRCPAEQPPSEPRRNLPRPAPFHTALLTATPGQVDEEVFGLEREDREHWLLRRRLEAAKPAQLVPITRQKDGSADGDEGDRLAALVKQVGDAIDHLKTEPLDTQAVVGVVVNRVLRARRAFEQMRKDYGPPDGGASPLADVFLVIGPAREVERAALAWQLDPIKTGREDQRRGLPRPRIIVATQTIEAGADLDFDALITEIAPLDALKQRFGRLNRAGRSFKPYAAILAHPEDIQPGKDGDPVYGERAAETWKALQALGAGKGAENRVDFGASPTEGTRWIGEIADKQAQDLVAMTKNAPVLMPAYVDLWSQTSPVPPADPETSLFLHGPDHSPVNVQIVWRADLERSDLESNRAGFDAKELFAAIPPKPAETIEVSLAAARRWLHTVGTNRGAANADLADAPERTADEDRTSGGPPAFRWAGPDSERSGAVRANQIRPNDLIIVPADYGGCDEFGWNPACKDRVRDVANEAAQPFAGRRFALRLTAGLIEAEAPAPAENEAERAAAEREAAGAFAAAFIELMAALRDGLVKGDAVALIAALREGEAKPPARTAAILARLAAWRTQHRPRPQLVLPYGNDEERPRGIVLFAPKGILLPNGDAGASYEGGTPATEDDGLGSASGEAQILDDHSADVRDRAGASAAMAGLVRKVAEDLALSGYLHDAGKADPRFQAMLYGGSWLKVDERRVLAKSDGSAPPGAREKAGLPKDWRHEALSVRIAREHPRFRAAHDPELVLWLIGVHHGYGRPLFPHADEDPPAELPNVLGGLKAAPGSGPQSLAFCFDGWDWAQIFERLKRRYGAWELARMEAIVRLADHRASEAAARPGGEDAT